ncbi:MAG TPA: class I SAM-dependent methyltransferase [Solirubrobacteraceae bacterium]|nr:class I SAM-dependent methyltransferase [Solirubrobacteraceae bacterium]
MISLAEADLLFRLATQADGSGCIVEVGSFRGRSTTALAQGARSSPVYAIDPHEPFTGELGGKFGPQDRAAFFRAMLKSRGYERVRLVNLASTVITPGWCQPVGLLWIDGDHTYEGVRSDWEAWRPHLVPRAVVAFDDSTDDTLGPHSLIHELVAAGELTPIEQVGKVTALQRP